MRKLPLAGVLLLGLIVSGVLAYAQSQPIAVGKSPSGPAAPEGEAFQPPSADAIPSGPYGDMVRLGRDIFRDTGKYAAGFTGNQLRCSNCHLDSGRRADSGPLWAAWVAFPTYRTKNKHVNTYAERLQGCFHFSMNGKPPPLGDKVLVALQTYSAWLAQGAPVGADMPGRGYPRLAKPVSSPDFARGQAVYQAKCALCHGGHGQGQSAGGQVVFPPLWGANSYNWGAGMHMVDTAAGFIKANMPLALGGTLSDQEAWDVALFVDSHERPQDPRFTGSVAETRHRYHDSPWSMYGQTVNGHLLGGTSVPPGGSTRHEK
jgi:thiosulfate dehydrogenase